MSLSGLKSVHAPRLSASPMYSARPKAWFWRDSHEISVIAIVYVGWCIVAAWVTVVTEHRPSTAICFHIAVDCVLTVAVPDSIFTGETVADICVIGGIEIPLAGAWHRAV